MSETAPMKIFPRNLTARADVVVRGNPVNARPESGVDNSHPGLEFDQRVLSRVFFPGLVFDFQYGIGGKVAELHRDLFASPNDLKPEDLTGGLYLWYILVPNGTPDPFSWKLYSLYGQDGYEVIRAIGQLEPGALIVVIGPQPEEIPVQQIMTSLGSLGALQKSFASGGAQQSFSLRGTDGVLQAAILIGQRANYLDAHGVIRTDLIEPGQLTQSLCSPWQWDFADCGCYYWAGSKPDIVSGRQGGPQNLNFQRDRSKPSAGPTTDPDKWMGMELNQPQMVTSWETLPFVIAETETNVWTPPRWPDVLEPFTREQVAAELGYLASVEHAVLVQYLYACYSIKSPLMNVDPTNPRGLFFPTEAAANFDDVTKDLFAAANEILFIAVDEMRHFRWANEAREILIGRGAAILSRAPSVGTGPRHAKLAFNLRPLTSNVLGEFITIEAPSKSYREDEHSLDGLYTHILLSIRERPDDYTDDERERLMEVIKLIIDEGDGHFRRLESVRDKLAGMKEADYLQVKGAPRPATSPVAAELQQLADGYYDTLLRGIRLVLNSPENRGSMLEQARRAMFSLHEVASRLGAHGEGVLFSLPAWVPQAPVPPKTIEPVARQIEELRLPTQRLLMTLAESQDQDLRRMAQRHTAGIEQAIGNLHAIVSQTQKI